MQGPSQPSTPEERAQRVSQRNEQAASILREVRTSLQEFFKTQEIPSVRRRITPLGNMAIYYGDFTYTATYIMVRFGEDGRPSLDLTGKSSSAEREELAKYLRTKLNLLVTVSEAEGN